MTRSSWTCQRGGSNSFVDDEELARRRAVWRPTASLARRVYVGLYIKHLLQANVGGDLDLLVDSSGAAVPLESH